MCILGLALWAQASLAVENSSSQQHLAAGLKAYQQGAFEEAIGHWTNAAQSAESSGDSHQHVVALEHIAHAQLSLGHYVQAIRTLEAALNIAQAPPQSDRLISVLGALGNAHIAVGPPATAEQYLKRSLELTRGQDPGRSAATLNDLGNLYAGLEQYAQAIASYRESAALAGKADLHVLAARALSNAAGSLRRQANFGQSDTALQEALAEIRKAQPSHEAVMTWVQIALASRELRSELPDAATRLSRQAGEALNTAATMAQSIGDTRGASYALGHLGALYEDEGRYAEALQLTRRAIFAAQQINAPESLYRWQWQAGRLLRHMAPAEESIAAYRRAVHTLQSIRREFSVAYGSPATSFRERWGAFISSWSTCCCSVALPCASPTREPRCWPRHEIPSSFSRWPSCGTIFETSAWTRRLPSTRRWMQFRIQRP
jgi:tetratricopeptide (TPR) repeat protein